MTGSTLMPGHAPLKDHPLANLFPLLPEKELNELADDIAENGQAETIKLHRGMILDGRNRYRACALKNLPVRSEIFTGDDRAALNWVISKNLKRRHLDTNQRAAIAARITTLKLGANQHAAKPVEISTASLPGVEPPLNAEPSISAAQAAEMLNVDRKTVFTAKKVYETGAPELQQALEQGKISTSAAADIAALPIEEQKKLIAAADPKAVKEVAKKNRVERQAKSREKRLDNMRKPGALTLIEGKKYGVHLIDIPREFESWGEDTGAEKSPRNHYRTEGFEYLANLRDKLLSSSADNCVVAMWAWGNSLQDQFDLLVEWGFASARRRDERGLLLRDDKGHILPPVGEGRYRSQQIWAKRNPDGTLHRGTGFWFIDGHENILIGARGDVPAPLPGTQARSLLDLPIGEYSEKPHAEIRDQLDAYFPGVPKLEWFARVSDLAAFKVRHPDWDVTGNEAGVPQQQSLLSEAAE